MARSTNKERNMKAGTKVVIKRGWHKGFTGRVVKVVKFGARTYVEVVLDHERNSKHGIRFAPSAVEAR